MWDWLKGKKTYIVAAGGIVGAWWGVYTGAVTAADAINVTYEGLIGMAVRHGVSTSA